MAGVRIFCNEIIPTTDWNNDYIPIQSKLESKSPLPTLVSFDLLNPLDNSGHGYTVSPKGGQIQTWGLHYENGAIPSTTTFTKPGKDAVSFIVAFRLTQANRYITIFDCIDSTEGDGHGFRVQFGGPLTMSWAYQSGATANAGAGTVATPELNTWYVAVGHFDSVNNTASCRFDSLGLRYANITGGLQTGKVVDQALSIGGNTLGATTSSMQGDIAFCAIYDGAFTAEQRDAMVPVGREILKDRGLI